MLTQKNVGLVFFLSFTIKLIVEIQTHPCFWRIFSISWKNKQHKKMVATINNIFFHIKKYPFILVIVLLHLDGVNLGFKNKLISKVPHDFSLHNVTNCYIFYDLQI